MRLPGGRLELATPIPQRPLVPSGEGRGKAETTNFQNDTQLVPRALPVASACQLFGWLLLPLLGTSQEGGAAPPCSPEPSHCPWAAVATAVCSLKGVYKPYPPIGGWLPLDNSKAVWDFQQAVSSVENTPPFPFPILKQESETKQQAGGDSINYHFHMERGHFCFVHSSIPAPHVPHETLNRAIK